MGAWGHDYFDNDGAQDLLCNIRSVVEKQLRTIICRKRFNPNYYEEVIAASALIAEQGETCGVSFPPITSSPYRFFDLVRPALDKIQRICADDDWLSTWTSETAKRGSVNAFLHRLCYMQAEQENKLKRIQKKVRKVKHKGETKK